MFTPRIPRRLSRLCRAPRPCVAHALPRGQHGPRPSPPLTLLPPAGDVICLIARG